MASSMAVSPPPIDDDVLIAEERPVAHRAGAHATPLKRGLALEPQPTCACAPVATMSVRD